LAKKEEYTCLTCDTTGTVEYVGFYEIGTDIICEYCYLEARKMSDDE